MWGQIQRWRDRLKMRQVDRLLLLLLQIESFLIAYQHQFGEVDNGEYFSNWTEQFNGMVEWTTVPITQLPGHCYLFGKRR